MNDSTEIGRRFSFFKPYFKWVDENDYSKGYYVSEIVYQNDGGRWYRGISFTSPEFACEPDGFCAWGERRE